MAKSFSRISTVIGPLVGVTLFVGALYVLSVQLKEYRLEDVLRSFKSIPREQVYLSVLFCILSYVVLTLYDVLAIRYVGERLRYYRIAIASFVGYTFSHNLGFSVITGGAARYRLFSCWGLKAEQIAQAIAFSGITFWFGFSLLGGFIFLLDPPRLPPSVIDYDLPYRSLGVLLLVACFCYVYFWSVKGRALTVKSWKFPPPPLKITLLGLIVSAVDWLLAAAVTYTLLPPGVVSFWQFVGVFQAAQVLAMISHVPGGIGIFESLVIAFYSETLPAGDLLGILLAYRVIYYLLPLLLSFLLFFTRELQVNWHQVRPMLGGIGVRSSRTFPTIASALLFISGVVTIISGVLTPAETGFEQLIHFALGVSGSLLLVVSRPLSRRLRSAWRMGLYLLVISAGCGFILEIKESALFLVLAGVFLLFKGSALRLRSFSFREWQSPSSFGAVISVIVGASWLGFLSPKNELFVGEVIVASLGTVSAVFLKWFFTAKTRLSEQVTPRSGALCPLVLNDTDFYQIDSKSGGSSLNFLVKDDYWIALGDPTGEGESVEVIWSLKAFAEESAVELIYYNCSEVNLESFIGCELVKIGDDAIVDLNGFVGSSAVPGTISDDYSAYRLSGRVCEITSIFSVGSASVLFTAGAHEIKVQDGIGVTPELIVSFLSWAKEQGFSRANLGLTPVDDSTPTVGSVWTSAKQEHFAMGSSFSKGSELRAFKQQFATEYCARFLVVSAAERLAESVALLEEF